MLCLKHSDQTDPDDLLEPAAAARLLGVNTQTLEQMRGEQSLPAYEIPARWLYRRGDLESASVRTRRAAKASDPVGLLRLTTRARNALLSEGVETIGQLTRYSPEYLLRIPNLGPGSIQTIERALAEVGYRLGRPRETRVSEEEGRAPAPKGEARRSSTARRIANSVQPRRADVAGHLA